LRRVHDDEQFTLFDLMRDTSDRELRKLRYLAVQQSLWEKERDANAEAHLDLEYLKTIRLVVERPESGESTEVAFEEPENSDGTFFEDF
jgi:hypothetical protein